MAGAAHDSIGAGAATPPTGDGAAPATAAPPSVAQAKARFRAAAAACDPAPFIAKHPLGSVVGAAALGMAAAQSPGVQRMITTVMEAALNYTMQHGDADDAGDSAPSSTGHKAVQS